MLALPLLMAVLAGAPQDSRFGEWKVETEGNRVLVSQAAGTAWPGGTARLVLRCTVEQQNGTLNIVKHTARIKEAYLFYPAGFPADKGDLLVTFGNEPKPRSFWGAPSQDGKSLFVSGTFTRGGPDALIRSMLEHPKMTLVVKQKKDLLPELSFDLAQLHEALKPWLEACPIKQK